MRLAVRTDVSAFGPAVQFRYERSLEPPDPAEGFAAIDTVPFERRRDPSARKRALILWCDGVLARSRSGQRAPSSPDDLEVVEHRGEMLRRYAADGWPLLGLAWRPEIAEEKMSSAEVDACFDRMISAFGVPIDVKYCPHGGGPPVCWCRKPLPGLGVRVRPSVPARSGAMHLCRPGAPGRRVRTASWLPVSRGRRVLQLTITAEIAKDAESFFFKKYSRTLRSPRFTLGAMRASGPCGSRAGRGSGRPALTRSSAAAPSTSR